MLEGARFPRRPVCETRSRGSRTARRRDQLARFTALAFFALGALLPTGCDPTTEDCPAGQAFEPLPNGKFGRCKPIDTLVDAGDTPDAGPPCGGGCAADQHCRAADHTCVSCLTDAHCSAPTPQCDPGPGECVRCVDNAACTDPTQPICGADQTCRSCADATDCTSAGLRVCAPTGACVECTDTDTSACMANHPCRPDGACSAYPTGQGACLSCDTDKNCAAGQLCVELRLREPTTGDITGTYCQWQRDSMGPGAPQGQCANSRPLSQPWFRPLNATSVDGAPSAICTLSTTTCPAFLQHRQSVAGCDGESPAADAACGMPDLADAFCRFVVPPTPMPAAADTPSGGGEDPRCTYPCGGDEDCPTGFACNSETPKFCSI